MLRQSIPHGGSLINRVLQDEGQQFWTGEANKLPSLTLSPRTLSDLELIATGAFSPLQGFLTQADYRAVVQEMRLANGLPWSLPITLAIGRTEAASLRARYPLDHCRTRGGEACRARGSRSGPRRVLPAGPGPGNGCRHSRPLAAIASLRISEPSSG